MKTGIIYIVTTPTGKVYVGQTIKSLAKRKASHKYLAKTGKDLPLSRAIRKYDELLEWQVLLTGIPIEELNCQEIKTIEQYDSFNNGVNCDKGGSSHSGYIMSEETKRKMSEAAKGRNFSEETKIKMSIAAKKRKAMSAETKAKIARSLKGKPLSVEHRKKLSESHKGNEHSEETKKKISISEKGKIVSEKTKKLLSGYCGEKSHMYGKKLSETTRQKQSESMKKYWKQKKKNHANLLTTNKKDPE